MRENYTVRPPTAAGLFYVDEFIENAQTHIMDAPIRALVSPHAGYVYSGFTAAHAYKMVQGRKYDCVIIVGPSHREYFNGVSIYPGDAYETPLGTVPVNKEIREELLKGTKSCKFY